MSRGANVDLNIVQGNTFIKKFRWASEPSAFGAITALSASPPATFAVPSHGLPPDWDVAVVSAPWARTLNAANEPPLAPEYYPAHVIDGNTIAFEEFNSTGWKFKTGGYIRYFVPISLAGFTARMQIRDRVGGTILLSLTTEEGTLVVDDSTKTISINMSSELTETEAWIKGVYDLELVGSSGVFEIAYGKVTLILFPTLENFPTQTIPFLP